jgi:predicted dehydrogenase
MANFTIVQKPLLPEFPRPIISIGAGGIVHDAHYPAYQKAGFVVAGLYDPDQDRARFMAEKFAVPRLYGSLDEAVAAGPAEAVFDVAVPAAAIPQILPHLPDGRGVLLQKPMGDNFGEAGKILNLCRQKNLRAALNFQLRYAPFILAAKSLIEQGAIGEVHDMEVRVMVYTPWHLWSFMAGISFVEILYHSIHYIDLVRSFLGEPRGVYGKTVKHPDTPNMDGTRTNIIFDYGDMVRANVTTNHHHKYGLRHQESYVKWEGTKGAIKAKMGLLMNYPTGEPDQFEYCRLADDGPPAWQPVAVEGTWFPDAFIGTMASLMRAVEGSAGPPPTSVEDAFKTMALVEAICQASAAGATPIPTEA